MENLSPLTQHFDDLNASLNQIDALLNVVMSIDLTELKAEILMNYLWVISNSITAAKKISETLLNKVAPVEIQYQKFS